MILMKIDLNALHTLSFAPGVFTGDSRSERKETIGGNMSYKNTLILRSMSFTIC